VDVGIVDEIFGVFIGIFLTKAMSNTNAHLLLELLILFLVAILISCVALGAVAVRGREILFAVALVFVIGLVALYKFVIPEAYDENSFKFLGFAIIFWYIAKEITKFLKKKLPEV
jgi:hypothetical protein